MLDMKELSFITPEGGLDARWWFLTTETEAGRAAIEAMAREYVTAARNSGGGGALFDVTMILYAQHPPAGAAFCDAVEAANFLTTKAGTRSFSS